MLFRSTNVIRLAPSLLITEEDIQFGLEKFDAVLADMLAMPEPLAAATK